MKNEKGFNVWIKGNRCFRCKNEWKPRSMNKKPKNCSKCNSPYWNKPKMKK